MNKKIRKHSHYILLRYIVMQLFKGFVYRNTLVQNQPGNCILEDRPPSDSFLHQENVFVGWYFPEGQFHLACFDFIKLRETSSQKFSNKENEFHETRIHTLNICWSRGHEHYWATNSIGWCVSLLNWLLFELSWRQKVGEQFLYYFGTFFFSQLIIYSYEKSSHIFLQHRKKFMKQGLVICMNSLVLNEYI